MNKYKYRIHITNLARNYTLYNRYSTAFSDNTFDWRIFIDPSFIKCLMHNAWKQTTVLSDLLHFIKYNIQHDYVQVSIPNKLNFCQGHYEVGLHFERKSAASKESTSIVNIL